MTEQPPARFTWDDWAVTTSDAKKTETVRIAGNAGARGGEAAMYELDPSSVAGLKSAFEAIKEPEPAKKDGKK